ncbi:MAG TPA: RecX family transcriptional regulator [Anaerolineales bacterium]|nr:RecX family transcriptional regulator [Anaerolineales bacterium]
MGIVTALKQQPRDVARVNVYIDEQFRFGLTKVLATQLRIGQELSDQQIEELLTQEQFELAYRRALQLISRRPQTIEEIRMKLHRKQAPAQVIERVIERLLDTRLLDDFSFARAWVDNRQSFRPRGSNALRAELRQKGVASEIIEAVLADFDDEEAASRAAEKAYPRYRSLQPETAEQRMMAYLARRGFNYRLCRKAVDAIVRDAPVSEDESEVEQ